MLTFSVSGDGGFGLTTVCDEDYPLCKKNQLGDFSISSLLKLSKIYVVTLL